MKSEETKMKTISKFIEDIDRFLKKDNEEMLAEMKERYETNSGFRINMTAVYSVRLALIEDRINQIKEVLNPVMTPLEKEIHKRVQAYRGRKEC